MTIIPGLPNDIALQVIVVGLPRALHGRFRGVSRAWSTALHPNATTSINALRKELHISEVFLLLVSGKKLRIVLADVALRHFRKASLTIPGDVSYHLADSLYYYPFSTAFGSEVFMPATYSANRKYLRASGQLWCFDVLQWSTSSTDMNSTLISGSLCSPYAGAAMDGYVYVAGGIMTQVGKVLKRVERMEVSTKKWEALPDMQRSRYCTAAVVLKGRLCVIGGFGGSWRRTFESSGEMWDPETRQWTLVPELWPAHIFLCTEERVVRPIVAVVGDRLYALRTVKQPGMLANLQEIMYYEDASKLWSSLGRFCFRSLVETNCGVPVIDKPIFEMLAAGDELLVLCYADTSMVVFSAVPNPPQAFLGGFGTSLA